jgi:hypothetical protein
MNGLSPSKIKKSEIVELLNMEKAVSDKDKLE